jgi:signal transduction histidine kinase
LREQSKACRLECGTVASAHERAQGGTVEIKIGIQHVNREIIVESNESAADVEKELLSSIGTGGDGVFTVTDERGRKVLIPVGKIAYVDLGEENARHVGFGAV